MNAIGLTGGIGSGKSTVAGFLAELGAVVIDADKVGHRAFQPDTELWREVVAAFGREILTPTGEIDRQKLGKIVFRNPDSLKRLNEIMHPRMYEIVKAEIEEHRRRGVKVVVLEATLLLEAGWTPLVDEIWVTVASEPAIIERLKKKNGMSRQQALSRISAQLSLEEKIKQADVVIDTDCSLDDLKTKVRKLWQKLALS